MHVKTQCLDLAMTRCQDTERAATLALALPQMAPLDHDSQPQPLAVMLPSEPPK